TLLAKQPTASLCTVFQESQSLTTSPAGKRRQPRSNCSTGRTAKHERSSKQPAAKFLRLILTDGMKIALIEITIKIAGALKVTQLICSLPYCPNIRTV